MAFTHIPLRRSIPAGALGYLVGYVLVFIITAGRIRIFLSETLISTTMTETTSLAALLATPPTTTTIVGWVFHNSFQTPTQIPISDPPALVGRDLVAAVGGPFLLLYLVPPLVLIATGYFAARGETPGINGELYTGGATTLGFLPLALLGAFVFTASINRTTIAAGPDILISIATGIVYPTIFGGFGGYLARRVKRAEQTDAQADRESRRAS